MKNQKGISTLVGIIIIIAVALVAFGGVFAYQYYSKSQNPNSNDQLNLNSQNPNSETNPNVQIENNETESDKNNLSDTEIGSLAEKNKDESLCEKITEQLWKDVCYDRVAIAKQNPALCEKAGEQRDFCYNYLAKALKDESLCEKISGQGYKNTCFHQLAVIKKDISLCDKLVLTAEERVSFNCQADVQREINKK